MRALLILPVAAALGLGAWLLSTPAPTPAPPPAPAVHVDALSYAWPAGTGYRYRLDFDSESSVARFATGQQQTPRLDGHFRLAGELELRSHGVIGGKTRLALRFGALPTASVKLLGRELLTEPGAVDTHLRADTAWLSIDRRGRVALLGFAPDASHLFRNVVQLVVSEIWMDLGGGAAWSTVARAQHGEVEQQFTRRGATVERRRARYRSLQAATDLWTATVDALATAQVEPAGPLLWVKGHETLGARGVDGVERLTGTTRFEARLVDRFTFTAAGPPSGLVSYRPGQSAEREGAWDAHMKQRIAGLTADELLNTLAEHGRHGKLPRQAEFLWRAASLLHVQPELCAQLADLFESDAMGEAGRLLIIDLLTHSGAPGSQAAVRRILDSPTAEASGRYGMMYQRLSLIQRPDEETVAMARARYLTPGVEGAHAAAYTLGAVAGRSGPAVAEAIGARLERDLLELPDDQGRARRSLIFALGNAAQGAATVRGFVDDAHPELRYAAAAALRKQGDPASRAALIDLTADAEHRVAQRALRSLADASLSAEELGRIAALVDAGRINEVAYHALVNLLTPYVDDPTGRGILRRILTLKLQDSRVKGRIRALLGEA